MHEGLCRVVTRQLQRKKEGLKIRRSSSTGPAATTIIIAIALAALAAVAPGCGNRTTPEPRGDPTTPTTSSPSSEPGGTAPSTPSPEVAVPEVPFVQQDFKNNKTIHFVSSDPPNNALLSAPPERVTVNFSSDLGSGSFISVKVDGREVSTGGMILPIDNRSVSVAVNPYAGTGNYTVNYAAYWSDGSYCEGNFGFSVKLP